MGLKAKLASIPTFQFAMVGVTLAVIGTYIKAYQVEPDGFWSALAQAAVIILLVAALVDGVVVLVMAFVLSSTKSPRERVATGGFVLIGVLFVHALAQLGRDDYIRAIVPVFAGILTAWGVAAFLPRRTRSSFSERFAPRPPT